MGAGALGRGAPGRGRRVIFSSDGGALVFASDRGAQAPGEIHVSLATWTESDPSP